MGVGGSLESATFNGRNYSVAADADVNLKLGGFENEVMANGDGTARLVKTRVPMSAEGLTVDIDDAAGDHEFLQDLADSKEFFPLTLTLASGAIWQGSGQITGDLQRSTNAATAAVNVGGTGKLTKQ